MNQQIDFVSTDFFKLVTFIVIAVISLSDGLNAQGIDPSNTGMGWNISLEEQITHEVRGLFNELNAKYKIGWLYHWNTVSIQVTTAFYGFISGLGYVKYSEPEMFYFSATGIVGNFLIGAGGQIKLLPHHYLKITESLSGNFTIRTNNGSKYNSSVQQANYGDRQNFLYLYFVSATFGKILFLLLDHLYFPYVSSDYPSIMLA